MGEVPAGEEEMALSSPAPWFRFLGGRGLLRTGRFCYQLQNCTTHKWMLSLLPPNSLVGRMVIGRVKIQPQILGGRGRNMEKKIS